MLATRRHLALLKSIFTEASDPRCWLALRLHLRRSADMEGEVVTADIEFSAAITPFHIVGIDLLFVIALTPGSSAYNTDIIKGPRTLPLLSVVAP